MEEAIENTSNTISDTYFPKIWLYAVCKNEADILPFFFRHYDSIVERYVLFDNYSIDNTAELIRNNPKVKLKSIGKPNQEEEWNYDYVKNQAWKESRGKADYVICCNVDEFLYHPLGILQVIKMNPNATLFCAQGYQMVYQGPLDKSKCLLCQVNNGYKIENKTMMFNPNKIEEMWYGEGARECWPQGKIITSKIDLNVFHFNLIWGVDKLYQTYQEEQKRLKTHWVMKKTWQDIVELYEANQKKSTPLFHCKCLNCK